MADKKFVKARCTKTNLYLGLELEKRGSEYKVVNAIPLDTAQAKLLPSEVEQRKFETNENLIACRKCGQRRVGGCSCTKKTVQCAGLDALKFACIYCDSMEIDYSLPTEDEVRGSGGAVKLSQGQEVKIRFSKDKPLKKIMVGVGWDPATGLGAANMDVDSSVVVMSGNQRSYELVYFGALQHPSGCVVHHGDNLTGTGDIQDGDDENISVFLDQVPSDRDKIVFVLNIYECVARRQTLDRVKNLYIRLFDPDTGKTMIEYRVNQNMAGATGIVIGVATRRGGDWHFKAVGKTVRVPDVQKLASQCASMTF